MSSERPATSAHSELLRQSLAVINELEAEVDRLRQELDSRRAADTEEPIALIGAGCRLPGGVDDLESYWRLLKNGIDAVAIVPPERRALGGWQSGGDSYSEWHAGLVDRLDMFDPLFFGISAREAATMDPQQRLVLEVAWEALEKSGYAPGELAGSSTGVFVGLSTSDYAQLIRESGSEPDVYVATGNAHNAVAGRLSFLLGLRGPSMALDTACSSSLVAIHVACLSLRARNCDMALAGGVNVLLSEQPFQCFRAWGMVAPDGKCKAFDAAANGFVRSEGCGVVVLKRMSDAVADGDNILAVIRGSAVNQDGRSSGLTVPNGPAQEAVIRQALTAARIDPADISYVEAHGTGTSLGDPIEAQALANALGEGRTPDNPLVVGSVKTNLGHLESAAGVASILKVILALQRERIPAHLHFRKINPNIDWASVPVEIPIEARDWRRGGRRRIAGISSFGFSGTNAHVILEEATVADRLAPQVERPLHLFTLSARTAEALRSLDDSLQVCLDGNADPFPDIAYTANAGRSHFSERLAVVSPDTGSLRQALAAGDVIRGAERPIRGKVAFLFTGQGSPWPGMCRELYDTSPVFRDGLDECAGRLRLERPLLDVIYGSDAALLEQTAYTQPALFAIEWSLAQLWKSWGIEPNLVLGHSVGEYAALTVAGVWTLEEGLRLIAERGRLMQALGSGWGMISVQSGPEETEQVLRGLEGFVSIAARNAPASTVVSGRLKELSEVDRRLAGLGLKSTRLQVSHGFHSAQMEGVAQEFARMAQSVEARQPRCGIVSSVTGRVIDAAGLRDKEYWRRQVRNVVQFQTGMETVSASGCDVFLEVGPAPTLCGLGRQCIGAGSHLWAPSIRRERGAWKQMLESLAQLYVRGAGVNWSAYDAPYGRRRVALPTYPFQRQRYWIEQPVQPRQKTSGHPLPGTRLVVAGTPETYVWETEISATNLPYLVDHRIQDSVVAPATLYVEMAVSAARELLGELPVEVSACEFQSALTFPDSNPKSLQLVATGFNGQAFAFRIFSRTAGSKEPWIQNASGQAGRARASASSSFPSSCPERDPDLLGALLYDSLRTRGIELGPSFRNLERAWRTENGVCCEILAPDALRKASLYTFHPALMDSCIHALLCIPPEFPGPKLMDAVGAFRVYGAPQGTRLRVLARIDSALIGSMRVFDENGSLLASAEGIQRRVLPSGSSAHRKTDDWLFRVAWVERRLPEEGSLHGNAGFWLIFADQDPVGNKVADEMRSLGAACGIVRPGVQYRQLGSAEFTVRVGSSTDIECVLEVMRKQTSSECRGILHLWSLDSPAEIDPLSFSENRQTACGSIPALVQALVRRPVLKPVRTFLITSGAVSAGGEVQVSTVQAPMWGLGRVLAHEHPELWGGLVDIDPVALPVDCAKFLAREVGRPGPGDQAAMRGASRYVARLERLSLPLVSQPKWRSDGTYVITGGLGGIGGALARWIVERGASFLLLVGRTKLPPRDSWPDFSADTPMGAKLAIVTDLEKHGATVHVAEADVADEVSLRDALGELRSRGWPPVRGIFHAAGVAEARSIVETDVNHLEQVLRAKVQGAWLLHRIFEDQPLDCFVLFSSAAAILGPPALSSYAAGNAFLDALARYRAGKKMPATSIAWGPWGEVGMAAHSYWSDGRSGIGPIPTTTGFEILEQLLAAGVTEAAVLPIDWSKWQGTTFGASEPLLTDLAPAPASNAHGLIDRMTFMASGEEQRQAILQTYLVDLTSRVLGFPISEIDAGQPLTSLGLDSLLALEFRNALERDLGVSVSLRIFFDAPTLAALANQLDTLAWIQQSQQNATPEGAEDREHFEL